MSEIILKANINECTVENWQSNAGEVNARVMSVEMSDDLQSCGKQFVTFDLADGTKYESLVVDGKAKIPIFEESQFVKIGLYAENVNGNECEKRYSAHPDNVYVSVGSFGNADKQPKPTPGDYAELLEKIENIENTGGGGSGDGFEILGEVNPTEEHTNEQVYCAKAIDEMVFAFDETIQEIEERKQDTLIGGENIKTINGESLLGSGNISIAGGSGGNTNNKVFERIATVTVVPDENGELPTKISITADDNGNPFELTDIYCDMYLGMTDGANGRFYIMAGNKAMMGNMNLGFTGTEFRYWHFRYDSYGEGNGGLATAPSYAMPTKTYPNVNLNGLFAQPIPVGEKVNINKVDFIGQAPAAGAKTFAAGTTITLWGVRK